MFFILISINSIQVILSSSSPFAGAMAEAMVLAASSLSAGKAAISSKTAFWKTFCFGFLIPCFS